MSSISDIKNEIFGNLQQEQKEEQNRPINQMQEKNFYEPISNEIDINMLKPFNENPFKLCNSEDLEELAESIKDEGLLNPVILWKKEDSYIILSGHNRIEALKMLGYQKLDKTMYKIKEDISLDNARLILVDTNLVQRKKFLPSEKARAYKIQQSVLNKSKSIRSVNFIDENAINIGEMAEDKEECTQCNLENKRNIYNYLRLNYLINKLLEKVDDNELSIKIAIELSYLDEDTQEEIFIYFFIDKIEKLNLDIAKKIRQEYKKMPINRNTLDVIIEKMKKKKVSKQSYKINVKDIEQITDKSFANEKEARDFILKCIKFYEENN